MVKALTTTVGRVLFALPFGIFGLFHLMGADKMGGMVPSWVPGGVVWVYITGVAMILACISILIKKEARLACLGLAALMGTFVLTIHLPGMGSSDPMMAQMAMAGLLKDTALAGAALGFAGIFSGKQK